MFGCDDGQSDGFVGGAKLGSYKCQLHYTVESAMEYYLKKLPEVHYEPTLQDCICGSEIELMINSSFLKHFLFLLAGYY